MSSSMFTFYATINNTFTLYETKNITFTLHATIRDIFTFNATIKNTSTFTFYEIYQECVLWRAHLPERSCKKLSWLLSAL